jgi:hypothetical protein
MNRSKLLASVILAGAAVLPAAAQDRWHRNPYRDSGYGYNNAYSYSNGDVYRDRRDLRRDYWRIERLRAKVARDRARLDEDIRCGRRGAAAHHARELERDERELAYRLREAGYDREAFRGDYYYRR